MVQYYHLNDYLSIEGFNRYRDQMVIYENQNPDLFITIYIVSYVVLITCCIPGTIVFDLLAGFLFGCYLGSILVIFSYAIGAFFNFIVVRYFLKDILHHRFDKFRKLIHGGGRYGLLLNLISLRLIAVIPFWVLNIVAALLKVNISTFLISTIIGIIPASVIYVVIGDGVRDAVAEHQILSPAMLMHPKIWLPMILLGILFMLPNILKAIKHRWKQKLNLDENHN